MRVKLTPGFVLAAEPPPKDADRIIYWDEGHPGFGLMVTADGHRSFLVQYRAQGRSRRMHLKRGLNLSSARQEARAVLGAVARGQDPLDQRRKEAQAGTNTLQAIGNEYVAREAGRLRSMKQRRVVLERLVYPTLGSRQIADIRRSDIVRLLDRIQDKNGPVMADHTLAVLRRLLSWHASRTDDYRSPIVRGMSRTSPKERARQRTLTDDEIRAVWGAAEALKTPFTSLLQFILLTGARRAEAARMTRQEINGDDWLIPAARFKGKRDFLLPLSAAAMTVLAGLPAIGLQNQGFIFTTDGNRALGGFSKFKRAFDKNCGVTGWTIHDLRRTARTLMTRAGVDPDHAERALGHIVPGIRGVYDRHQYAAEKRGAFEALANQIDRIVNPKANVLRLRG